MVTHDSTSEGVLEKFSRAMLGACAVARGNEPIYRGNAAILGLYVLDKYARCVEWCYLARCSNLCIPISKQPRARLVATSNCHFDPDYRGLP